MVVLTADEPEVVISGIGGFFPKSNNVAEFADLLMKNKHGADQARWKAGKLDVCDLTCNIPDIESFDASYFGIHRQQVTYMDPMQRLALESTVQAVMDAGLNPTELRGRRVACYMASCISENDSLMFESVENGFGVTGQARAMMANRISYWLNVIGPSCSFDASWCGGAQVLKAALDSVRSGQCEAALVGTTNLALNIYPHWLYKELRLTSPDGFTRPLDNDADGYSRGEGIIILLLQRAEDARRCYAQLVHADMQYEGCRRGPLCAIRPEGLTTFLGEFYRDARVDPALVQYLELYACGNKDLDSAEMESIESTLCKDRSPTSPLLVGSVKGNVGHTEAAAALTSVVKVLLAMEQGIIPATLHHKRPNLSIPSLLGDAPRCRMVTENEPWSGQLAAVNCLGLSSSYGHVLLRGRTHTRTHKPLGLPLLTLVSARSEDIVKEVITSVRESDVDNADYRKLVHSVFSSNIPGHLYRSFLVRGSQTTQEYQHYPGGRRPVWLVYSGMGSQWRGMGRDLLRLPVFSAAVDRCNAALQPLGLDLLHILTTDTEDTFDNILHAFVGIAAVQVGLTDVLRAVGLTHDGLVGHSVGELGCAYADGCITAEQMILSAYYRGKASLDVELVTGMMAAVGLKSTDVRPLLPPEVDVACHNGPDSCTLSGPTEPMRAIVARLQSSGVFARLVNVSNIAYHSRYIKPAAPLLLQYLRGVIPAPKVRSAKWLSSSVPEAEWTSERARLCSADYLTNNLLSPVLFEEASAHIPAGALVIEVAPHGLLQAILRRSLPAACVHIPLTRRAHEHNLEFMLTALGKAYLTGADLNVATLYPPVRFPVGRGTPSLAGLVRSTRIEKWRTGLEEFRDYSYTERAYHVSLHVPQFRDVHQHVLRGAQIVPLSTYLMLAYDILNNTKQFETAIFEDIKVERQIELTKSQDSIPMAVMVQRGNGQFEASDIHGVLVRGRLTVPETPSKELVVPISTTDEIVDGEYFYRELERRGYYFKDAYAAIKEVKFGKDGCVARVLWKNHWRYLLSSMLQLHAFKAGEVVQQLHKTVSIRKIVLSLEKLPESDQEIEVSYQYATGCLTAPVLQVVGIYSEPQPPLPKELHIQSLAFVTNCVKNIKNAQAGIDICTHVFLENTLQNRDHLRILEIRNQDLNNVTQNCVSMLHRSLDRHTNIQSRFDTVLTLEESSSSISNADLVIISGSNAENALDILRRGTNMVLTCRKSEKLDGSEMIYPVINAVTFQIDGFEYSLLKLAERVKVKVIDVTKRLLEDGRAVKEVVQEVHQVMRAAKEDDRLRIYVFSKVLPANGIDNFVGNLRSAIDCNCLRFIFAVDDTAPTCTASEQFYQRVFQRDLAVNVLQEGRWGLLIHQEVPVVLHDPQPINYASPLEEFRCGDGEIRPSCVGVSACGRLELTRDTLSHVDYAGVSRSGRKVMGVARVTLKDLQLQPDPHLLWTVPDAWSDTDAASVPYSYAMAYYILVELVKIKAGHSVLVQDACSGVGQALCAVAHAYGATIFTTVRSAAQRAFLRSRFIYVKHMYDHDSPDLERHIKEETAGYGITIVVSCAKSSALHAVARCVGHSGTMVQLGVEACDSHAALGMNMFLNCDALYGVDPAGLLDKPADLKRRLCDLVHAGIQDGTVKPIERRFFRRAPLDHVLRYVQSPLCKGVAIISTGEHKIDPKSALNQPALDHREFSFNPEKTHVLFGDDLDLWLSTMKWMASLGAKEIHTVGPKIQDKPSEKNYVNRQIHLLQKHYGTNIKLFVPTQTLLEPVEQAIKSPQSVGTVTVLHSSEEIDKMDLLRKIDALLVNYKCAARFICLWKSQAGVHNCYKRLKTKSPILNLRWQSQFNLEDALDLTKRVAYAHYDVSLVNEKEPIQQKDISQIDFALMLPRSLDTLRILGDYSPINTKLSRVSTSSPRTVREVPPIVVVPGVSGSQCPALRKLLTRLASPAWIVDVGRTLDLNAAQLAEKLSTDLVRQVGESTGDCETSGRGKRTRCYNILGVSWGGALALEMTLALEKRGYRVQLYLLDGAPNTVQAVLRHQGNVHRLQASMLSEVLNINTPEDMRRLETANSWEQRLALATELATGGSSQPMNCGVHEGLCMLEHRLRWLMEYSTPTHKTLDAHTCVIRPRECSKEDTTTLAKMCKNMKLKIVDGNHFTMLQQPELSEYINNTLQC